MNKNDEFRPVVGYVVWGGPRALIEEAHVKMRAEHPDLYRDIDAAMEAVATVKNLDSGKKWDRVSAPNLQ